MTSTPPRSKRLWVALWVFFAIVTLGFSQRQGDLIVVGIEGAPREALTLASSLEEELAGSDSPSTTPTLATARPSSSPTLTPTLGNQYRSRAQRVEASVNCTFGVGGAWRKFKQLPLTGALRPESIPPYFQCMNSRSSMNETNKPGLWYGWVPASGCAPILSLKGECQNVTANITCKLDVERVCTALKGRNILLLGDSTMQETKLSIQLQFSEGIPLPKSLSLSPAAPGTPYCDGINGVAKVTLTYTRSDHLLIDNAENVRTRKKDPHFLGFPFTHQLTNNSIVFMNRGVHFAPTQVLVPSLRTSLQYISKAVPHAVLVYQLTPIPVHPSFFQDLPTESVMPVTVLNKTWGWENISAQNVIVRELLRVEFPEIIVISPEHFMSFRADNRKDPVHSCLPGPFDWLPVMFGHTIIEALQ